MRLNVVSDNKSQAISSEIVGRVAEAVLKPESLEQRAAINAQMPHFLQPRIRFGFAVA